MLLQPGDNDCCCIGATVVAENLGASLSGCSELEPDPPLATKPASSAVYKGSPIILKTLSF